MWMHLCRVSVAVAWVLGVTASAGAPNREAGYAAAGCEAWVEIGARDCMLEWALETLAHREDGISRTRPSSPINR